MSSQAVSAQTPKPIDATTSVTAKPLDESPDASTNATADDEFSKRQKALNLRTEENNYRYGVAQHNCYSKFFVNHCLDKARDEMRTARQQIRTEQLALDDEQRAQHAKQRDRANGDQARAIRGRRAAARSQREGERDVVCREAASERTRGSAA